jgi:hypothetical protein
MATRSGTATWVTDPVESGAAAGFGVYLHVPFCHHRCGYCDFATAAVGDRDPDDVTAEPMIVGDWRESVMAVGLLVVGGVFALVGLIVLLVTHQLEDAFAMGDRIAVIRHGRIEQVGPIADVFRRPANHAVAEIMGIRNLLRARVTESGGTTRLDWDGLALEAPPSSLQVGEQVTAYIRPEDVKLIYPDRPLAPSVSANVFEATITLVREQGSVRVLQAELPNRRELEIRFPLLSYASLRLEPGAPVRVALRRHGLTILDAAEPAV